MDNVWEIIQDFRIGSIKPADAHSQINAELKAAFEEGRKEGDKCTYESVAKAFHEGQREMRRSIANKFEGKDAYEEWTGNQIAHEIMIVPLTPRGGEAEEIRYSGQCNHKIPFGQPCVGCRR
jgi:hypothetical protein